MLMAEAGRGRWRISRVESAERIGGARHTHDDGRGLGPAPCHHAIKLDDCQVIGVATHREHASNLESKPAAFRDYLHKARHSRVDSFEWYLGLNRSDARDASVCAAQ